MKYNVEMNADFIQNCKLGQKDISDPQAIASADLPFDDDEDA